MADQQVTISFPLIPTLIGATIGGVLLKGVTGALIGGGVAAFFGRSIVSETKSLFTGIKSNQSPSMLHGRTTTTLNPVTRNVHDHEFWVGESTSNGKTSFDDQHSHLVSNGQVMPAQNHIHLLKTVK